MKVMWRVSPVNAQKLMAWKFGRHRARVMRKMERCA